MNSRLFVVAAIGLSSSAQAVVIHDTFAPNFGFNPSLVHTAAGGTSSNPSTNSIAVSFTVPSAGLAFDSFSIVTAYEATSAPFAWTTLHADSGNGTPGAVVESLPLFLILQQPMNPVTSTTVSQSNPALSAGATYWMVLSCPAGNTFRWYDNSIGASGFSQNANNQGWATDNTTGRQPVLRIEARPVPAPAGIVPLLGAMGLTLRRRR
ncbi:hypothetical protein PHYC_02906 [Phycisphaerales bacterium]|nr:hypothetical protein PHYC_02906 [Phycisphaerales bacterium]